MKVYAFPADEFGCGSYRLIWPGEALKNQGVDVTVVKPSMREQMFNGVMDAQGKMVDVQLPKDADVVVFQRVTHFQLAAAIPLIRQRGVAVVIDMDDDLTCIDPRNPAYEMLHPRSKQTEHSWNNALDACRDATMVSVSTPALLKRYAAHGRGMVYDNYIQRALLDLPRQDNEIVGWPGSLHSHPGDLQVMGSSVNRLVQEGVQFAVIGAIEGVHDAWGVPKERGIHFTGPTNVGDWGRAVSKLGIGVAPLADTKFNAAKSWLKMAEMAAAGVPCIGSDRAEYRRLHEMSGGMVGALAKDEKDWYRKIQVIVRNPEIRAQMSRLGREFMATMTIEANAWKLAEIWQEALKLERTRALGAFSRR